MLFDRFMVRGSLSLHGQLPELWSIFIHILSFSFGDDIVGIIKDDFIR